MASEKPGDAVEVVHRYSDLKSEGGHSFGDVLVQLLSDPDLAQRVAVINFN